MYMWLAIAVKKTVNMSNTSCKQVYLLAKIYIVLTWNFLNFSCFTGI